MTVAIEYDAAKDIFIRVIEEHYIAHLLEVKHYTVVELISLFNDLSFGFGVRAALNYLGSPNLNTTFLAEVWLEFEHPEEEMMFILKYL